MLTKNTIAAIATGNMNSGISIIRISGENSFTVISKIFTNYKKLKPNNIIFGKIKDCKKNILDEVLVSYFKAPNSFTGEDVCEINCHGGKQITSKILELVLSEGARLAEPGEFSKRAFLNGKMDLSQAEAIIDLINSKTEIQSKIAIKQLEGDLSKKIIDIREDLINLLAQIEVSIDYPEYDYEEIEGSKVKEILNRDKSKIKNLIEYYEEGKYIKNGVNVAIIGKPNMGKSSLLNVLAKYEKAIVTDIPGTTRDVVEETINLSDLVINLSDTAGIRKTDNLIEQIGVEKSLKVLEEVDLVIYMISADTNIDSEDIDNLSNVLKRKKKLIVAINKSDKKNKEIYKDNVETLKQLKINNIVSINTVEENGIEELKSNIKKIFLKEDIEYNEEYLIVNKRHKELLENALNLIIKSIEEIENFQDIDIVSISIKEAASYLGKIIGEDVSEDVIKTIFQKFCLGK